MKNISVCMVLLIISLLASPIRAEELLLHEVPAKVYFSPRGGAQEAITQAIQESEQSVFVQAYSFTSAPIAKALIDAHARGIIIEAVLDKSQRTERYSGATFLTNAGIPVWIDAAHAIAHNKVIIIDQRRVITGSFNFTKSAEEKNAENLLILDSPELARTYLTNFKAHQAHSSRY